jgi:hypothetical protein
MVGQPVDIAQFFFQLLGPERKTAGILSESMLKEMLEFKVQPWI